MKDDFFDVVIACVGIAWDTDGNDADALDLPDSVVIENPTDEMIADCDEYNDAITNYLSDKYGYCIEGCHIYKCRKVNVMGRKTEKDFDYNLSTDIKDFAEQVYDSVYKRGYKCTSGDELYIYDEENIVKVGDKFRDYPAVIAEVHYKPKKWWQFWKRKKQVGYRVRWL